MLFFVILKFSNCLWWIVTPPENASLIIHRMSFDERSLQWLAKSWHLSLPALPFVLYVLIAGRKKCEITLINQFLFQMFFQGASDAPFPTKTGNWWWFLWLCFRGRFMLNQTQPSFRYMLDKLPPFLAKSDRNKKKRTKMIGFANVSSF